MTARRLSQEASKRTDGPHMAHHRLHGGHQEGHREHGTVRGRGRPNTGIANDEEAPARSVKTGSQVFSEAAENPSFNTLDTGLPFIIISFLLTF